jgi:hypothetical protein
MRTRATDDALSRDVGRTHRARLRESPQRARFRFTRIRRFERGAPIQRHHAPTLAHFRRYAHDLRVRATDRPMPLPPEGKHLRHFARGELAAEHCLPGQPTRSGTTCGCLFCRPRDPRHARSASPTPTRTRHAGDPHRPRAPPRAPRPLRRGCTGPRRRRGWSPSSSQETQRRQAVPLAKPSELRPLSGIACRANSS